MIEAIALNWILKTIDDGLPVLGWTLQIDRYETYYLSRASDGMTWARKAGRRQWRALAKEPVAEPDVIVSASRRYVP